MAQNALIGPTPRNALLGMAADGLAATDRFLKRPAGDDRSDPMRKLRLLGNGVAELLGLGDIATTVDRASYGLPQTRGTGMATQLLPEARNALLALAPVVAKYPEASAKAALGMVGGVADAATGADRAMLLYHGTNFGRPITRVGQGGPDAVVEGMFASPDKAAARSHGSAVYRFTVPDERIAPHDLTAFESLPEVRKLLDASISGNNKGSIIQSVLSDNEVIDDLAGSLVNARNLTSGDVAWEAQNIRGKVAKAAGFDAVPMRDEHGLSYLVLPGGANPRPYNNSAKRLFNPQKYQESEQFANALPAPPKVPEDILAQTSHLDGRRRMQAIAQLMSARNGKPVRR